MPVAAVGDRHGFEVEPALAKKLRNEIARLAQLKRRRNPRPEDQKTAQKLRQKIEAKRCRVASIENLIGDLPTVGRKARQAMAVL